MNSPFLLPLICIVAGTIYVLPTIVALRRGVAAATEVALLDVCLGWTGVGWVCALILAFGPRRARPQPRPSWPAHHQAVQPEPAALYRDGVYVISCGRDTVTWAIAKGGRWTIVYEVGGADRLIGDVSERDVPLEILAQALTPAER